MKFQEFVLIKENNISQEVETIFQQTSKDIDDLFAQLLRGTTAMLKNAEKAKLPEELQKSIMADLQRIAQKVKGAASNSNVRTDPRAATSENVMVDTYIKDIIENLSVVNGLGNNGTGQTGKPVYDFKSTLNNVKHMVMDRMNQLKDSVLKAMGMVGDIHGKLGQAQKQISDIHGNTVTNLRPEEHESVEDGLVTIGRMAKSGNVKLYGGVDGEGKGVDPIEIPKDRHSLQAIISKINPKKVYVDVGGKIAPINFANRNSWTSLQSTIDAQTKAPVAAPVSGNRLRARKVQDAPEGGIRVNNNPTMGNQ